MINTRVFCPFERIAALISYKCLGHADSLNIRFYFGDKEFRDVVYKNDGLNHPLGFNENQRKWALSVDEIKFDVEYVKNDVVIKSRKGVCINDLLTEPTCVGGDGKVVNSRDVTGAAYFHKEAVETYANKSYRQAIYRAATTPVSKLVEVIPFMGYIYGTTKGDDIVIHGPAPHTKTTYVGNFEVGGVTYPIFSSKVASQDLNDADQITEQVEKSESSGVKIYLEGPTGSRTRYKIGQLAVSYEGVRISPVTSLQVLQSIIKYEDDIRRGNTPRALVDGALVFKIRPLGNTYVLTFGEQEEYEVNVRDNIRVRQLCSFLSASEDGIYVTNGKRELRLISNESRSCYVMSLSFLLSQLVGTSASSFVESLKALVEAGYVKADDDGISAVGNTAAHNQQNPMKVCITGDKGPRLVTFYRRTVTENDKLVDGALYILGLDPDINNSRVAGSDHYIVVMYANGTFISVYDPWEYVNLTPGADVTSFLKAKDSVVYEFLEV